MMSTLGAEVWMAGAHAPSADSDDAHQRADFIVQEHIEQLVLQVKNYDLGPGLTDFRATLCPKHSIEFIAKVKFRVG